MKLCQRSTARHACFLKNALEMFDLDSMGLNNYIDLNFVVYLLCTFKIPLVLFAAHHSLFVVQIKNEQELVGISLL